MTASVGTGHVTSRPIGSAATPAGRILRKCARMAALLLATAAAVLLLIPPDHDDYLAIIGAKVERLEKTAAPRIVFVGGSNLAFGLDSRAVEESLGRPVVNMGMGFNMGLRFMLDLVEPRVGAGDLVVLVPEYNLFFGLLDGDERLIDVLELYPPGMRHIQSQRQVLNLVENLPRHARFKVERLLQGYFYPVTDDCVYCPRAFNEYGDNVAHLGLPSKDVAKMDFLKNAARGVDTEAIVVVNAFAKKVEDKGARTVMLFPCLPRPHYEQRRDAIEDLHAALGRDLRVPLLSTPLDYVYPVEDFFDWVYHLNREGRSRRTARVIDQLRAVVEAAAQA
ncbi:MAG: hypothetical protein ABR538_15375 [Candidatus Binatia bacterium]